MKVAIYARVSTDKQDNDNQLIRLKRVSAKRDGRSSLSMSMTCDRLG